MAGVVIDKDFMWPVLASLLICLQYYIVAMVYPIRARKKAFPQHWLKAKFGDEHQEAFGTNVARDGAPDNGDGRYGRELSYKDWLENMSAQRVHYNYLEHLPVILFATLASGLSYQVPAAVLGLVYVIGRFIYGLGYTSAGGVNMRIPGFLILMLSLAGQLGVGIASSLKIAGVY